MSGPFVKYDLGPLQGGELVTITIKERANVRLLDASNLRNYETGQRFLFHGGQALRSPLHLRVASPNHWFIVIDLGGAGGTIHSNVSVTK